MAQPQLAFEAPDNAAELEHSPVDRPFGRRLSDLVLTALTQAMKQGRDDIAERLGYVFEAYRCGMAAEIAAHCAPLSPFIRP